MISRPQRVLLALLAFSSIAQANWIDDRVDMIIARQDSDGEAQTPGGPAVTSSRIPPVSTTPSSTPSSSPSETATPPSSPPPSSTTSTESTPGPETTQSSTTTTAPSTTASATTTNRPSSTTSFVPTVVQVTRVTTLSGSPVTVISDSTATSAPTATSDGQSSGGSDGKETSNNGMSPKTKSTIIGVVVGVGGAILLAGLGVVAWRIWGRKKHTDEGDELMGYNRPGTSGPEKTGNSSASGSSPFQSTLENYHNPAKQVNASSNF